MHLVNVLVDEGEVVERVMTDVEPEVFDHGAEVNLSNHHQSVRVTVGRHAKVALKTRPDKQEVGQRRENNEVEQVGENCVAEELAKLLLVLRLFFPRPWLFEDLVSLNAAAFSNVTNQEEKLVSSAYDKRNCKCSNEIQLHQREVVRRLVF